MIVNVVGDGDKRAVIYTLMKIFQTLGDVLLVTNNSYLRRLSETGESGGHFQNTMIVFTNEGVGDFFDEFKYSYQDFSYTILDGIIEGEADLTIHCVALVDSEEIKDELEYVEDVKKIDLWGNPKTVVGMAQACEKFESFKVLTPMPMPIVQEVAAIIAPYLKSTPDNIVKIATTIPAGSEQLKADPRPIGNAQKKGIKSLMKGGK